MTVPDGAPLNVKWADRMAQQLQIAGSELGIVAHVYTNAIYSRNGEEALERVRHALSELDAIREEIAHMHLRGELSRREAGGS